MNPQRPSVNAEENSLILTIASAVAVSLPVSAPSRGHILYVDDDDMARMVLGGWLRLNHYDYCIAANPVDADALLDQNVFDLVISDIHMPGNHRLEWVERVLNRENPPAVILVTGLPQFET